METQGIIFYNRYTGQMEQEKVLGEGALRWVYGTPLGKLSLHLLIKRGFFSRLMGWMKDTRSSGSPEKLRAFVEEYNINMADYERPVDQYTSFNDFFYRKLAPGARPLCAEGHVALPADARHSGWQDASEMTGVFVKNQRFDLPALLGDAGLAGKYAHGTVVLSRLCPVDYHRFHFPAAGVPEAPVRIPGPLASVSPYCLRHNLAWLWTNKRELTVLHTEELGDVLCLAVGATGVGAIYQTYESDKAVAKGDEHGYFGFGGSTVMTFFEPGRVKLAEDIAANTSNCIETFARMGDTLGTVTGC